MDIKEFQRLLERLKNQNNRAEVFLPENEYARGATMRPTYASPVSEFIGSILGPQPRGSLQRRLGYEGFTTYEKGADEGVDYRLLTGLLADPISKAIRPDEKPSKLDYAFSGLPFVPGVGILGKPTQKAVQGIGNIISPAFDAKKRDTLKKMGVGIGASAAAAVGVPVLKYATKKVVEGPIAQLSSVLGDAMSLFSKNSRPRYFDDKYDPPMPDESFHYDSDMEDPGWRTNQIYDAITGVNEPSKLSDTIGKMASDYTPSAYGIRSEIDPHWELHENLTRAIDDMAMPEGYATFHGPSAKGTLNMVYKELIDANAVPKDLSDLDMKIFDDLPSTIDDSGGFQKSLDEVETMVREDFPGFYDPELDEFVPRVRGETAADWISKTLTGLMHAEKHNPVALRKAVERVEAKILREYPHEKIPAGPQIQREIDQYDENTEIVLNLLQFIKKGLE